ncbi:MAG: hypothetical protein IT335_11830 [Thermomicrobiales bacterium]|nr:hypothetical protein [Thermomicrobiales bacterium]
MPDRSKTSAAFDRRTLMRSAVVASAAAIPIQTVVAQDEWPPFQPMRALDFTFCKSELDHFTGNTIARLNGLVLEKSLAELTTMMDAGELTSHELTLYYLDRIQTHDAELLNAIIDLNPLALEDAAARDTERQEGNVRGPLHGIPVVLKDNIATGDYLRTTAGALALQDSTAHRDAFLVSRLIEGGAVILGKTNLSEWANWMHSTPANGFSAVGGQSVSPYWDWLDPSGSSTGSAVAVSAGFAPLAIGTETVGSIISPSSRNGVAGLKPSLGLISRDLVIPITAEVDSAGPIALTVSDIALAMNVLASGGDLNDPRSVEASRLIGADFTANLTTDQLDGKRVAIIAFDDSLSDEDNIAMYALEDEIAALESIGAEVIVFRPDPFPDLAYGDLCSCGMRVGVDAYLQATGAPFDSLQDIVTFNEENPAAIPYGQERLMEAAACTLDQDEVSALGEEIRAASAAWLDTLFDASEADVLVSIDEIFSLHYCMAGFPAISVPHGVTLGDGIPSGLTLIGRYLSDVELLGYAYAFEQTGRWRVPPPVVASILPAERS